MRWYVIIALLLSPILSSAQTWQKIGNNNPKIGIRALWRLDADSGLYSMGRPVLTDISLDTLNYYATRADLEDTSIVLRELIENSVIDTISLSNRILTVQYNLDTSKLNLRNEIVASILDTTYLSLRIDANGQAIIDSAANIRSALNAHIAADNDLNPANEMQSLAFDNSTRNLSISGANTVNIPHTGIPPVDSSVFATIYRDDTGKAEIRQQFEDSAAAIRADLHDHVVADLDLDTANERQTIGWSGQNLSIQYRNTLVINPVNVGLGNVPNVNATNASNITSGTLSDSRLSAAVTLQGNVFNGPSQLVKTGSDGKLIAAVIPALALVETQVFASEAAMLAWSGAEMGDVAVRIDINASFILQQAPASTLGNWVQLLVPDNEQDPIFTASDAYVITSTMISEWQAAYANSHTHANKTLLDSYTQTEVNLADAVSKRHEHANASILDDITASYTTAEQTKLAGIAPGAEVNVNADWSAVSGDAQILNKPSTFPPSTHSHVISDVTGLQSALDSKQNVSDTGTFDASKAWVLALNYLTAESDSIFTAHPAFGWTTNTFIQNGTSAQTATANITGQFQAGQGRFTAWNSFGVGPAVEAGISSGSGFLVSYDRTASAYIPLIIQGGSGTGASSYIDINQNAIEVSNFINIINTASDTKIRFNRSGGRVYRLEHDASQFYLYNQTDATVVQRWLNSGQVAFDYYAGTGNRLAYLDQYGLLVRSSIDPANILTTASGYFKFGTDPSVPQNGTAYLEGGTHSGQTYLQSLNIQPLNLNPLGNPVYIAGNTVWHAGNDGAGSGLDADLLDGQHGSYYYSPANIPTLQTVATAGNTYTGTLTLQGTTFGNSTINSTGALSILNTGAAQQILTGGLLASDNYADASSVPTNGIYSKGVIRTSAASAYQIGNLAQIYYRGAFNLGLELIQTNDATHSGYDMFFNNYGSAYQGGWKFGNSYANSGVFNISSTGALNAAYFAGNGTKLLQTDNSGNFTVSSLDPSTVLTSIPTLQQVATAGSTYTGSIGLGGNLSLTGNSFGYILTQNIASGSILAGADAGGVYLGYEYGSKPIYIGNNTTTGGILLYGSYYNFNSLAGTGNRLAYVNPSGNLLATTLDPSTIATTSTLAGYVPYTGATTNVDLNSRSLTATGIASLNILSAGATGVANGNIWIARSSDGATITDMTTDGSYSITNNSQGSGHLWKVSSLDRMHLSGSGSLSVSGPGSAYSFVDRSDNNQGWILYADGGLGRLANSNGLLSSWDFGTGNQTSYYHQVNVFGSNALSSGSYSQGNYEAFVNNTQYLGGARPGYGFHIAGVEGIYLYTEGDGKLRVRNGSTVSVLAYESWVTSNFEAVFSKNTAFNKNFGTAAGTVAEGNDSRINNGQTAYSWGDHAAAGYQPMLSFTTNGPINITGGPSTYDFDVDNTTAHWNANWLQDVAIDATTPTDGQVLQMVSGKWTPATPTWETAFSKNTAFNKNFGTTSGTVAEGNDSRIVNGQTAFGWGNHSGLYLSVGGGNITGATAIGGTAGSNQALLLRPLASNRRALVLQGLSG